MVIGHSSCPNILYKLIYSFHMPLFFILSGYFLNQDSLTNTRSFVINKVKKLAIPLICAAIISLLLHNVLFQWGIITYGIHSKITHLFSIKELFLRLVLIVCFLEVYDDPFLGPTWFIQSMFWSYLIIAFVHRTTHKESWTRLLIYGFSIMAGFCIVLTLIHMLFPTIKTVFITRIFMAGVFIYIGALTKKWLDKWQPCWWHFILLFGIVCTCLIVPFRIEMQEYIDVVQWLTLIITSCAGTFLIYGVIKLLVSNTKMHWNILTYIGRNSIYVLFLHMLMFKPISYLILEILHLDSNNSYNWIIYAAGSIILCLLFVFCKEQIKKLTNSYGTRIHHNAHI
ncbi:MAG: acyltransferase [Paludibacteraceae bacterium]|nr:acyltransferase [Paludibacteraceae bacterium]